MPLFASRTIEDFPIGNRRLSEHRSFHETDGLKFHSHAWIEAFDLEKLANAGRSTLIGAEGTPLAWFGGYPKVDDSTEAEKSFLIVHPWDLLRANEAYVGQLPENLDELAAMRMNGAVHPLAVIDGHVTIGEGTSILPGVVIEGNVVIGANCKIGPNCYIRGNTSIGDSCHIGNAVEIKNSIILSHTNIGHLSYVGDSILAERVNFGAGTMTSNLRHDGKNHRSQVGAALVDTGRRKFGCIAGDGVHTGINTSIYPGRKLFPGVSTRPGEIVQRDLHPAD